jgi:archaemetzincin
MDHRNITLVSFGSFEESLLNDIAKAVKREYRLPVIMKDGYMDLSEFYDPVRHQYDGNRLLAVIDKRYKEESFRTMGLFTVDIFIPILTYIFGQAFLNGTSGIASVYRLSNESYGMDANEDLKRERFRKEVIHELGHTFGLIHCHVPSCVMRSCTYVEEIDQKDASLCSVCRNIFLDQI